VSLDLTALRLLKHRDNYQRLARSVPARAIDQRTSTILSDFGRYFAEHEGVKTIKSAPFTLWFKLVHPRLTDEDVQVYANLFKKFDEDVEPAIATGLMERLVAADSAAKIADTLEKWNEGGDFDLLTALAQHQQQLEAGLQRKVRTLQDLTPIEDIIAAEENEVGFKFRLACLNAAVKPLRDGDFMIWAARPDAGKTTAIASEVTFMAPQVDKLYPGQDRSIIWLCNEGPSRQIVYRTFQAALGATDQEMIRLSKIPDKQYGNKLRADYAKALGGRPGVLRVFPIHDKWSHEVEDIIKQYKPALVVFDMIDNVKFGGEMANLGTRTDQVLETMYQWARQSIAVRYECAVIATSQVSAEGEGQQWPPQSALKDSKTGKQGAADVIVMMGKSNEPSLAASRYISTPKNKRKRTGVPSCLMAEVIFDGDHARMRDTDDRPTNE
jgi:replicative DNA helicase